MPILQCTRTAFPLFLPHRDKRAALSSEITVRMPPWKAFKYHYLCSCMFQCFFISLYFLECVVSKGRKKYAQWLHATEKTNKQKQPCSFDEAVSVCPVRQQVGSFHIVDSDVHVSEGLREEVVNLPRHIQDVAHTDKQTDKKPEAGGWLSCGRTGWCRDTTTCGL